MRLQKLVEIYKLYSNLHFRADTTRNTQKLRQLFLLRWKSMGTPEKCLRVWSRLNEKASMDVFRWLISGLVKPRELWHLLNGGLRQ